MGRDLEWMVMSIIGGFPRERDVVWEGLGHGHWGTKPPSDAWVRCPMPEQSLVCRLCVLVDDLNTNDECDMHVFVYQLLISTHRSSGSILLFISLFHYHLIGRVANRKDVHL